MGNEVVQIVFNKLPRMGNMTGHLVGKAVAKTVADIEADAKVSIMTGAKTGQVYKRKGGKTHQASAPGQPPATDEGDLAASIQGKMVDGMSGVVTATSEHAGPMEYGTKHVAARPFMRPALDRAQPGLVGAIEKILGDV